MAIVVLGLALGGGVDLGSPSRSGGELRDQSTATPLPHSAELKGEIERAEPPGSSSSPSASRTPLSDRAAEASSGDHHQAVPAKLRGGPRGEAIKRGWLLERGALATCAEGRWRGALPIPSPTSLAPPDRDRDQREHEDH